MNYFVNQTVPVNFHSYFKEEKALHSYETRLSKIMRYHKIKTTTGQCGKLSINCQCAKDWNSFQTNCRVTTDNL